MMFKLWKREWAVIIGVFIVLGFVLWVFSGCADTCFPAGEATDCN